MHPIVTLLRILLLWLIALTAYPKNILYELILVQAVAYKRQNKTHCNQFLNPFKKLK